MLSAAGSIDIFIAKHDRNGRLLWVTKAGGASGAPGSDQGLGIATDAAGNSYLTGIFSGAATFGESADHEIELTAAGSVDIFVAKYDRKGRLLWARRAGGSNGDQGDGIATDGLGNSYVTGFFVDTARFGEQEVNQTVLSAAGGSDLFLAKYDRNGRLVWATRAGGSFNDNGLGIATSRSGESYLTGSFQGVATFGEDEEDEVELTTAGGGDIFVTKYDR